MHLLQAEIYKVCLPRVLIATFLSSALAYDFMEFARARGCTALFIRSSSLHFYCKVMGTDEEVEKVEYMLCNYE